jgi:hypothetical protein
MTLSGLSAHQLVRILRFLQPHEMCRLVRTCKGKRRLLVENDGLLAPICRRMGYRADQGSWVATYRHLLDLDQAGWHELFVCAQTEAPDARDEFTLDSFSSDDGTQHVCLFGGMTQTEYKNDTWLLNVDANCCEWKQVLARGPLPPVRAVHDAAIVSQASQRLLVVHGGLFPAGYRFNDTWVLDLAASSPQWCELCPEDHRLRPAPRFHHSFTLCGEARDKLVIFGGHDYRMKGLADLWMLDLGKPAAEQRWHEFRSTGDERDSGLWPDRRAYHSASVAHHGRSLVIFGGHCRIFDNGIGNRVRDVSLSDLWVLDVSQSVLRSSACWTKVRIGSK